MDKPIAVLEITSKALRLVVGYVIDNQVYVLYAMDSPYPHECIDNGLIVNSAVLAEEIKKISNINDNNAKLTIRISDVVLVLPPYGLDIFQSTQSTYVVSEQSIVQNTDIKNLNNQIYNQVIPNNNAFVDIIPDQFVLQGGVIYTKPPIGVESNSIIMTAKIHTLPTHIINEYREAVKAANINVKRVMVASFGASELISSLEGIPDSYILMDIGSRMTTLSLVGNKQLFGTVYFAWGGDNITQNIAKKLEINEADAEKFKLMYGYDTRKMNFEPVVCTSILEDGTEIKHHVQELNAAIKEQLDELVSKITSGVADLLKDYDQSYKSLPIVMVGGGSLLKGLKEYVEPKIINEKIYKARPTSIGARNPNYVNVLGVLKASNKYQPFVDEYRPRVSQLTRNNKQGDKE